MTTALRNALAQDEERVAPRSFYEQDHEREVGAFQYTGGDGCAHGCEEGRCIEDADEVEDDGPPCGCSAHVDCAECVPTSWVDGVWIEVEE